MLCILVGENSLQTTNLFLNVRLPLSNSTISNCGSNVSLSHSWSTVGEKGIFGGAVKCVWIRKKVEVQRQDNHEVCLEAATLERVWNISTKSQDTFIAKDEHNPNFIDCSLWRLSFL